MQRFSMYEYGQPSSWIDAGWELPLHGELGIRDQANIVHLDEFEEMIWVGTQRGRLLSYTLGEHEHLAYSRFNVDVKEERVIQILTKMEGVLSLTRSNICFNSRGGVSHGLISPRAVARMTNNGSVGLSSLESFPHHMVQLAAASDSTKTLFYLDSIKGELSTFFDLPHTVSKIHACLDNPLLAIGGLNGHLSLVEGRVPRVTSTLAAHPFEITSIASNQQYIYTCGKRDGSRVASGLGSPQIAAPDVFVKMFDLRNLKQAIPVSVPSGAMKAVVVNNGLMILSSFGIWQQADLFPGSNVLRNSEYFKTNCYAPHSPDLSPSVVDWSPRGDFNALLDTSGVVHLWIKASAHYPLRVNDLAGNPSSLLVASRQAVMPSFPNPVHLGNFEVAFDSLPTRVYSDSVRDGLWQNWLQQPHEEDSFFNRPTPLRAPLRIPDQITNNLKEWDKNLAVCPLENVKYGSLVARARRVAAKDSHHKTTSPFRKRRAPIENIVDPLSLESEDKSVSPKGGGHVLSRRWQFTQLDFSINHSLFPFALYNKTDRTGLENGQKHLDILNPIVQVLYALTPFKTLMQGHTCDEELCVACELGNIFFSMDQARFSRCAKVCEPIRLGRVIKKLWPTVGLATTTPDLLREILARVRTDLNKPSTDPILNFSHSGPIVQIVFEDKTDCRVSPAFWQLDNGEIATEEPSGIPSRKFSLASVIATVTGESGQTPHNVAIVAVSNDLNTATRSRSHSSVSGLTPEPAEDDWVLFNDFVVTYSSLAEATEWPEWRKPVLAIYTCKEEMPESSRGAESPLTLEMFCRDVNLAKMQTTTQPSFVPLNADELEQLCSGELVVALDTEFVALGLAAMEIREDGTREIARPGDMAVGRVSVLRVSNSDLDGVPFIDHYVAMDETDIKDYVTRFSGIRPGDLDPKTSPHWLTSSKSIYQKLRFLLDCGTKFVGHGLHTDFRIINLWAPQSSLIDTVDLFHQQGQRFLSLKFLANRLLEKSIQGDVHCSIEDAKTALDIYRVYQKLKADGSVETTIKSLYDSGRTLGWK